MRLMLANQSNATKRRVYFDLRATDGITPVTAEVGQPQVSTNGGAWTNTGSSVVTEIGNGRYYATLTQTLVATAGDIIETRYKTAATAESPGDSVQVVGFDPDDAAGLGLSRVDAAISSRSTLGGTAQTGDAFLRLGAPAGASVSADVAALKVDTASLVQWQQGSWEIKTTGLDANKMIIYGTDGVTVLHKFLLTDSSGTPTFNNPFKRAV